VNQSLQILRAVAATMVVLAHLIERLVKHELVGPHWEIATRMGSVGVEIFFVISGFIVGTTFLESRSGRDAAARFFIRRFLRVAPSYYVWSTLMGIKLVLVDRQSFTLSAIAASLAFLPHYSDSGLIQPIYGLGWSLNFEMYFYAILASAILFRNNWVGAACILSAIVTPVVLKAGSPGLADANVALAFYGTSVALLFLVGFGIAIVKRAFPRLHLFGFSAINVLVATAIAGLAVWFTGPAAVACTCCCVLAAALEKRCSAVGPVIAFGSFLGDASYSTYLTHSFVLGPLVAVYRVTVGSGHPIGIVLLLVACVVVASVVGALAYLYVEKPLDVWTQKVRRARPAMITAE
jgi:peptidoglycan/LPS O-acetylase OafA/YrhL